MAPEKRQALTEVAAIVSLLVTLLAAALGAVQIGRRDAEIDKKVDQAQYYRDIGAMKTDIRAIRCKVDPAGCLHD